MFRQPRITVKVVMVLLFLAIVSIYLHMGVIKHIISMIVSHALVVIALTVTASYPRKSLRQAKGKASA